MQQFSVFILFFPEQSCHWSFEVNVGQWTDTCIQKSSTFTSCADSYFKQKSGVKSKMTEEAVVHIAEGLRNLSGWNHSLELCWETETPEFKWVHNLGNDFTEAFQRKLVLV